MHDDEQDFDAEIWDASEKMWLVGIVAIVAVWAVVLTVVAVAYAA